MLKTRAITGIVLVTGLVAGLIFTPPTWIIFALLLIASLAALEWARLCQLSNKLSIALFVSGVLATSFVLHLMREYAVIFLVFGTLLWVMLALHIVQFKGNNLNKFLYPPIAIAVLSVTVFSIDYLVFSTNFRWALSLFAIVSLADIAAYFCGRQIGRKKLAPLISPGKTVEGFIGALLAVAAIGLASGALLWEDQNSKILLWGVVCVVVATFSVLGDLYVSLNKRRANVKNSGSLLPGHGGVLDRIDSTLAAAPIYTLCVVTVLQ